MIIRFVKLTIQPHLVPDFQVIFEESRTTIKSFSGCLHLELLQYQTTPNILFTLSHWENEEALEQYRQSEFFKYTWKKTKLLFSDAAVAWSTKRVG